MITWITILCKAVKLWDMPCRATQDRWVMVESSDKMWSSRGGNVKSLRYSCLENPMNSMRRQKDTALEDETPRLVDVYYATGKSGEIMKERVKQLVQCGNDTQFWLCLVEKTKSDAVKSLLFTEYLIGTWNVRSINVRSIVKQEMARVNISELKWMGMSEFNSDDHYIYYCRQESLRRME